jgi:hypothetical protein
MRWKLRGVWGEDRRGLHIRVRIQAASVDALPQRDHPEDCLHPGSLIKPLFPGRHPLFGAGRLPVDVSIRVHQMISRRVGNLCLYPRMFFQESSSQPFVATFSHQSLRLL